MTPERVGQLIALATRNPSEHEARTAALMACKAIAAAGLVILSPTDYRLALPWVSASAPAPTPAPARKRSTRKTEPKSPPEPRGNDPHEKAAVSILSRFKTSCVVCRERVPVGTSVWWRSGYGVWCFEHGREAMG